MKLNKNNSIVLLGVLIAIAYIILKVANYYFLLNVDRILFKNTSYIIAIIIFIILNSRCNKKQLIELSNFNHINLKKTTLSILPFIAYFLINSKFRNLRDININIALITFITTFLPVLFEEILFRYFSLNFLYSRGLTIRKSGFYTSLFFGLLHLINISHSNFISIINQSFLAFFLGMLIFTVIKNSGFFYLGCFLHLLINLSNAINSLQESNFQNSPITLTNAIISFISINIVFFPFTFLAIRNFNKISNDLE